MTLDDVGTTGRLDVANSIFTNTTSTNATSTNLFSTSAAFTNATTTNITISGTSIFGGNLRVTSNNSIDFGASALSWKNIYASGTAYIGGDVNIRNMATATSGDDAVCISTTGTLRFDSTGTCTVSSARFKHDIATSTIGLAEIMQLNPVTFEYNNLDDIVKLGLIAEEVAAVDPKFAAYERDGVAPRSLDSFALIAATVGAIKEQQGLILSVSSTLSFLQNTVNTLSLQPAVAPVAASTTFEGDIIVKGQFYVGRDTAGQAKILSGATQVRVKFKTPYIEQPIVTVSPSDYVDSMYPSSRYHG